MTYFQEFKTARGLPVSVEYSWSPGSETTYSPLSGADGGDACEVDIVGWIPDTERYRRLCAFSSRYRLLGGNVFKRANTKIVLAVVVLRMKFIEYVYKPTDADFEFFQQWIVENHVDDGPDYEDWER